MNTQNYLASSGAVDSVLVRINNKMYSKDIKNCKHIDQGYCLNEKRWCFMIGNCETKTPEEKKKQESLDKSGHKHIYKDRNGGKWVYQPIVNGIRRTLKKSCNLQEVVDFKENYIKGCTS